MVPSRLRNLLRGQFPEANTAWTQPQLLGCMDRLQVLVCRAEVLNYVESADCGLNPPERAARDDRRYRSCRCSELRARLAVYHHWIHGKCAVTAQLCGYQQLDGISPENNAREI